MAYENIIFETEGNVGIIRFNRPKALNAINIDAVVPELLPYLLIRLSVAPAQGVSQRVQNIQLFFSV